MDPIGMQPYVDFFNYMAYDLHGPWEAWDQGKIIRPQTSVVDIESTIYPLWYDGVDPSKVNLGIAFYGRGYTLANTSCTGIGCPYSGLSKGGPCTDSPGVLSLREITEIIIQKDLDPLFLEDIMIKQIVWDNQWMGYDDNDTIALKMQWGNENCLGGISIWSIDLNSAGRFAGP
jgi:chitinase